MPQLAAHGKGLSRPLELSPEQITLSSLTPSSEALLKRGHKPAEGFKEKVRFVMCLSFFFSHVLYKHQRFFLMLCGGFIRHTKKIFSGWIDGHGRSEGRNMV